MDTSWQGPNAAIPDELAPSVETLTTAMRERFSAWTRWPERYSVQGTVAAWVGAVRRSILSDNHMSDEYLHDLDKRRSLHYLLTVASELQLDDLLDWMIPIVDLTDDRFRDITTPDTDDIMGHRDRRVPEYWWYRRISTNPYTLNQFHVIADGRHTNTDLDATEEE